MNETLYIKCTKKGFSPNHTAEIGVYYPETSNILGFIKDGARTTLVEPLPECIKAIGEYFMDYKNVKLYPYAVADKPGPMELFLAESSTFSSELQSSPALLNDAYSRASGSKLTVQGVRFDEIDDGSIDLLSIDTEGSEWFAIKHMVSRPAVISVEMKTKHYKNPFYKEITDWMANNRYMKWYSDRSDIVFVKNGLFNFTFWEKLINQFK